MVDQGTLLARFDLPNATLLVVQGDITAQPVDALVNAANTHLLLGGGVAGAIARKGGPQIQAQYDAFVASHGPVETGAAALTGAGFPPMRWVVHAVGPVAGSVDSDTFVRLLTSAVRAALRLADQAGARSIALPAISAGSFGGDLATCTRIIAVTARNALQRTANIREIRLCALDRSVAQGFIAALG